MLIERQVAPALIVIGGVLVLPETLSALKGGPSQPSVGALIAGNLLAGVGLLMGSLIFLDEAQNKLWRALLLSLLVSLTFLLSAGTFLVALQMGGLRAIGLASAALAPLLGTAVGWWSFRREQ